MLAKDTENDSGYNHGAGMDKATKRRNDLGTKRQENY